MSSISFTFKHFYRAFLLVAGLAIWSISANAQTDAAKGEAIFKAKCTACHAIDKQVIGPALGDQLVKETDDKWLIKWIQNNQALIAAKDAKALAIYNQFNQSGMTVFSDLSDADAGNIITYVRTTWKDMQDAAKKAPAAAAATEQGPSMLIVYALLGVIILAFVVILVLNKVVKTLETLVATKPEILVAPAAVEAAPVDKYATVKRLAKNKKFVFFVLLCISIAGGSWTWVSLWNTNVHQGYQPVQPIKYPHDLHAGAMQIKCQYCHSGAYKSKNASIPSLNVCMNCHKVIDRRKDATEPSTEIAKIYTAIGFDPKTQKYDSTLARPVQWVRIHNLPDFAYFNHSQHVTVGKIECTTCHGPVQSMKEMYQYSPLTMKWCIQCHKRTEINYKGNAYYEKMEAVHELLRKGGKVTEAQMGGIECGKCHY